MDLNLREKISGIKRKAVLTAISVSSGVIGASAYTFNGMQNLSDFVDDMVTLVPKIIPLVIVMVILYVVKNFGKFMQGLLAFAKK